MVNNTDTVTISLQRYKDLESNEKFVYEKAKLLYYSNGIWGGATIRLIEENEVICELVEANRILRTELKEANAKTWLQKLLGK